MNSIDLYVSNETPYILNTPEAKVISLLYGVS